VAYYRLLSSSCTARVFLTTTELKTGVNLRSTSDFVSRTCQHVTTHSTTFKARRCGPDKWHDIRPSLQF